MIDGPVIEQSQQERLLQNANSILEWVGSKAESTIDFAAKEAPYVAQEIVNWRLIINAVPAVAAVLVAIGAAIALKQFIKHYKTAERGNKEGWGTGIVLSCIAIVVSLGVTASTTAFALKSIYAPRLVIIEYIKDEVIKRK